MTAPAAIAPWLIEATATLTAARRADRMHHALLIHAAPGTGGEWLAGWCTQLLLCTAAEGAACGICTSCRRAAAEQHPDLTIVRPIENSQQIRIEQIRELIAELALTAHQGGYKVARIEPGDALNRFAANALLKTLEEPPARTVLIVVAAMPSRLPATLVSRCQRIRIRAPSREESLAWLAASRGPGAWENVLDLIGEAPFAAQELDPAAIGELSAETRKVLADSAAGRADPVAVAERWSRSELPLRLACVENWLTECIRRTVAGYDKREEVHAASRPGAPAGAATSRTLYELLDRVRDLKASLSTPINRSLALESLLRSLGALSTTSSR